jgi:hypothetical protein
MNIQEAKTFVNTRVHLAWLDRNGKEVTDVVDVYEVNFVPFYGPCMITNVGEVRLDRIQACEKEVRRIAV